MEWSVTVYNNNPSACCYIDQLSEVLSSATVDENQCLQLLQVCSVTIEC